MPQISKSPRPLGPNKSSIARNQTLYFHLSKTSPLYDVYSMPTFKSKNVAIDTLSDKKKSLKFLQIKFTFSAKEKTPYDTITDREKSQIEFTFSCGVATMPGWLRIEFAAEQMHRNFKMSGGCPSLFLYLWLFGYSVNIVNNYQRCQHYH